MPSLPTKTQHPELLLARTLVLLVPMQVLLAFLGLPIAVHWVLGVVIGGLAITLFYLVRRLDAGTDLRRLCLAFVLDLALQPLLLLLGHVAPAVQGLHGINGIVAFGLAILVAFEAEESKSAASA